MSFNKFFLDINFEVRNSGQPNATSTMILTQPIRCDMDGASSTAKAGLIVLGTFTIDAGEIGNTELANSTISGVALGSNLADLTATDGTLTFSGTYNGSAARMIGLNLGNTNAWTTTSSTTFAGGVTTAGLSSSAGLSVTSISEGMLYIDSAGLVRKATDGRSLTYSSGTLNIDSELYTKSFSVNIASSTMSTTTGRFIQHKINKAITITQISCTSNSTTASSTMQIDERTSPNTAGTDVMYGTGLGLAGIGCDSGETSTTTFSNASIAANSILNFTVETPAVVNDARPTILNLFVFYTIDD